MERKTNCLKVLVDTSVWIDFFLSIDTIQVNVLESLLQHRHDICICGVILTEVLQGIKNDRVYKKTKQLFDNLIFFPATRGTYVHSADIYRALRKKGVTIRRSLDCLIAALAIEHGLPLLHHDKDFNPIVKFCGLKVVAIQKQDLGKRDKDEM